MKIQEHIDYWLNSAKHDLKTAEILFKTKKYDWCLYIGHLVIEKTIKAVWVRDNKNLFPPKSHNLLKLLQETNVEISEDIKIQLLNINDFHIETRYPDYKFDFYKKCNKIFTDANYKNIKRIYRWLLKKI